MRKTIFMVLVLLFFLAPGASCFGETAEAYYPLKEGMVWVYSVTSDKRGTTKITVTNLAPREIKGKSVFPRKWDVGGAVKYYFIGKDDHGVYRFAEQKGEGGEPQETKPKVYYLKNPVDRGTTWDISTKLGEDDLKVNVTIEAIREKVQVPGGTYNDCVKVKHECGGPAKEGGGGNLSLTAYEWYAPGVGLVKSMFTIQRSLKGEKGEAKLAAENTTYQLESFKP